MNSARNEETEKRIEACCIRFLECLVAAEFSPTETVSLESQREVNDDRSYSVRLNDSNVCGFTFVARALSQIYTLLVSESSATKRDLFYEHKDLYGEQRNLNLSITKICKLLLTNRTSSNVFATGRGIMMGDLRIYDNETVSDCSMAPIVVNHLSSDAMLTSKAQFVLVVEKDATFQKLIQEDFFSLFSPALLVTAKGYPDLATRRLLKKFSDVYHVPIFGLVDSDPHGVEIAITYKYGNKERNYEIGNHSLPNFKWIGLSRTEIDRYPVPEDQFLRMNKREFIKASKLCERARRLKDWVLLREINCLLNSGRKLELEAVSGIAPGFLSRKILAEKLSHFVKKPSATFKMFVT